MERVVKGEVYFPSKANKEACSSKDINYLKERSLVQGKDATVKESMLFPSIPSTINVFLPTISL